MERAQSEVGILVELGRKIEKCEDNKKRLLEYAQQLKNKCLNREIDYSEYESLLEQKLNGKTLQQWFDYYDSYIAECKKRIRREERRAKTKKVLAFLFFSATIIILISSFFYLRFFMIGFVIREQTLTYAQPLSLEFSQSQDYEWQLEHPGELQSVKLSGLIEGSGGVRVYIDNLLILDILDLEGEEANLTQTITGFSVEEALQNPTSPFQEEPLPSENATKPIENIIIPEEIGTPLIPEESVNLTNITEEIPIKNLTNITEEIPIKNLTIPEENITEIIPEEIGVPLRKFKDFCKETCNINLSSNLSLNKSSYTLKIEISNAKLKLDEIKYEVLERLSFGNITAMNITESNITNLTTKQYKAVIGKPVKWTKKIELDKAGRVKIELPKQAENITVNKVISSEFLEQTEEILQIQNETPQIQNETSPSQEPLSSSFSEQELVSSSEEEVREKAKFSITGKVVLKTKTKENLLSKYISRISIKTFSLMTGRAVTAEEKQEAIEVTIEDNATEYEIEYYTEAPQAFEEETAKGKRITISAPSELNYTDILAFTELPKEVPENIVKLYHLVNESRQKVNITKYDLNENNLTDYIEWQVERLSNQTYELEITIINVKSQPQVGKNWTVMFNTTGKANLTITAFNGTNWSNSDENYDLKFLEVRCGEQVLEYEWINRNGNSSVFIQDYECNETAFEISKVLTTGFHTLEFDFGGVKAYAYNTAGILNLEIFGAINLYNTSVMLKTLPQASSGYDVYDMQSSPPPSNYSEFYSNITDSQEYHLTVDAWNETVIPRTFYLIYSFDATAGAQTGTIVFTWNNLTATNYTGNFTYYLNDSTYSIVNRSFDMRINTSFSDSITSRQKLYIKVVMNEYTPPQINFTSPTPANNTSTTNTSILINVSIVESDLNEVKFNWNGTNYTIYNDSLVLMMNFENLSALGENSTYVADLSKYSNNGTAINGAFYNSSGKYGGAWQFDGVDDYINISSPISFSQGNTTSLWYKNSTSSSWTFAANNGTAFFVNGTVGTPLYYPINISGNNVRIGINKTGSQYFNGSIDEVRVWNRSLSASEIYELYVSNLQKYSSNQWYLYINQSKNSTAGLDVGTYTYFASAKDKFGIENMTETRTINITSSLPQIIAVYNNSINGTLKEGSKISVIINFTAYSPFGAGNLNHSSARINFTKTGEETRQNLSCAKTTSSGNYANYTCNVTMWWWDGAGAWNIAAYIQDNQTNSAQNTSTTFSVGALTGFVLSPDVLTWPGVAPGARNKTANTPILLNNTGNMNISLNNIQINATNLRGETTSSLALWAGNFSVAPFNSTGTGPVECNASATTMNRSAYTNITGASLPKGNFTKNYRNESSGQEQLYFCLRYAGSELTTQAYSTLNETEGSWIVQALIAALTIGKIRNRKKKSKIKKLKEKDSLVEKFSLITKELTGKENKKEIINLLVDEIKSKYKISDREIIKIIETKRKITIPATIFSKELGALEAVVKYMRENLALSYKEISELLYRNERTIWTAYNKAKAKQPEPIKIKETSIFLPLSIFNRKLTILEAVIIYLKQKELKYSEIASLLDRDQRNIWLIYSRAVKKIKGDYAKSTDDGRQIEIN